jgi:hypothetical protein
MRDLSLHVLDIAENSTAAGARLLTIEMEEDLTRDMFILKISDDGKGMDLATKECNPYHTGKAGKRFGLGLPLLGQAAEETGGHCQVHSAPGVGTEVVASFRPGHIDMKPVGDMGATVAAILAGNPALDVLVRYRRGEGVAYELDTRALRGELEGVPLSHPPVMEWIARDVNQGMGMRRRNA